VNAQGQYVIDENGEEIRGVWYIPRDACDVRSGRK
jgi:hypothetical protein